MKKRTKLELAVFVIAALMFLYSQISGKTEADTDASYAPTVLSTLSATDGQSVNASVSATTATEKSEETEKAKAAETAKAAEKAKTAKAAKTAKTPETDASAGAGLETGENSLRVEEDGQYNDKESVALYIHLYGHLPSNYMTKAEAGKAGWESGRSPEEACGGRYIGGDRFGNYEGLLPAKKGRKYTECDVDYNGGKSRGSRRIVFSNDGLVYYTGDHYESFELLYGEP